MLHRECRVHTRMDPAGAAAPMLRVRLRPVLPSFHRWLGGMWPGSATCRPADPNGKTCETSGTSPCLAHASDVISASTSDVDSWGRVLTEVKSGWERKGLPITAPKPRRRSPDTTCAATGFHIPGRRVVPCARTGGGACSLQDLSAGGTWGAAARSWVQGPGRQPAVTLQRTDNRLCSQKPEAAFPATASRERQARSP